ncbi:hypothetical protein CBR_g22063 [Chara braunii]|uniref:Uncharacterized protein n=1 Tax=Chara braunii TaxID=69332 RepID=A0A388L1X5_CHABU|nr:hypothetical protein CBR_g22063 [Chara braunii]|eukprot:GBG76315.1 hypothetical protein CBR_g22063 [Chara braunii]
MEPAIQSNVNGVETCAMETQDIVKGIAVVSNEGISAGANTTDCAVVLAAICEQTADMMTDGEASENDAGCVVADENVVRMSAGTLFPYDINWVPGRLQLGIVGGAPCFAFKVNGEWVPYPAPKATSWRGVTLSIIFDRVLRLNDEREEVERQNLCIMSMSVAKVAKAFTEVMKYAEEGFHYNGHDELSLLEERVPGYFAVSVDMRSTIMADGSGCVQARTLLDRLRYEGMCDEGLVDMTMQQKGGTYTPVALRKFMEMDSGPRVCDCGRPFMSLRTLNSHRARACPAVADEGAQRQENDAAHDPGPSNIGAANLAGDESEEAGAEDDANGAAGDNAEPTAQPVEPFDSSRRLAALIFTARGGVGMSHTDVDALLSLLKDPRFSATDIAYRNSRECFAWAGSLKEAAGWKELDLRKDDWPREAHAVLWHCDWRTAFLSIMHVALQKCETSTAFRKRKAVIFHKALSTVLQAAKEASHDGITISSTRFGDVTVHPFLLNYIQDYPERCALANVKFGVCPTCTVSKTNLDVVADFTDSRRSQTLETQLATAVFTVDDDDVRRAAEGRMAELDMHRHVEQNGIWGFYRGPSGDDPQLDYHLALQPHRMHTIEHGIFLHMIDAFRAAAFEKLPKTPQTEILKKLDARLQCVMETIDIRGSDDRHSGPQVEEEEEHDRSTPEKSDGAEDEEPENEGDDNDSSRRQSHDTDEDDDSDGKSASERTGEDQSAASERGGLPFPSRTLCREGERQARNGSDTEERVGDRQIVQHVSAAGKEDAFFVAVQATAKLAGETAEEGLRSHIAECGIQAVIGECNRMMTTIRGEITWQLKHWFWAEKGIPLVGTQQTDHHLPARNKMRTEMKKNKTWRRSGDDQWGAPAFKTALLKVFQMRKEGRNLGVTLQQLAFAEMVIQCEIEQTTKTTQAAEQIEKLVSIKQAIVSSLRSRDTVMSFSVFKLDRSVSVVEKAATLFRSGTLSVHRPGPPSTTITDDDYDIEFILPQSTAAGDGDRRTDSLCAAP